MKISVVIPYYRAGATIERALHSVWRQTKPPAEIWLVDDASGDQVDEIVGSLEPHFVETGIAFHLLKLTKNGGPSLARNSGWDRATGDYVAFLDADDLWHPQKLEICAHFLEQLRPIALCHGSSVCSDSPDGVDSIVPGWQDLDFAVRDLSVWRWLLRNQASTPAILVRRDVRERFDPRLRFCEDHDLWLRIATGQDRWKKIAGPALTFLGRPSMTSGGHSSKIHRMRMGEVKMYWKFTRSRWWLLPGFPVLAGFSLGKHVYFLIRTALSPRSCS